MDNGKTTRPMTILYWPPKKTNELTRLIPIQSFPHLRPQLQYRRLDPLLLRLPSGVISPTRHALLLGGGLTSMLPTLTFFGRWLALLLLLLGAWRRRRWRRLWSNHTLPLLRFGYYLLHCTRCTGRRGYCLIRTDGTAPPSLWDSAGTSPPLKSAQTYFFVFCFPASLSSF